MGEEEDMEIGRDRYRDRDRDRDRHREGKKEEKGNNKKNKKNEKNEKNKENKNMKSKTKTKKKKKRFHPPSFVLFLSLSPSLIKVIEGERGIEIDRGLDLLEEFLQCFFCAFLFYLYPQMGLEKVKRYLTRRIEEWFEIEKEEGDKD